VGGDGRITETKLLRGYYNNGKVYEAEGYTSFFTTTEHGFKIKFIVPKDGYSLSDVFTAENIYTTTVLSDYNYVDSENKLRHHTRVLFPEYKAGRHATPEDLLSQFPDAKECLLLMGISVLELEGYEADDIQGTVAYMSHGRDDVESYILSGDRDLLQLIDDKVTVLLASNSDTKEIREAEFRAEYGISPSSFVEMKALMGDSSDNIPGVAGIGKKTAAQLISAFGTLDGIYENIDDKQITKGVREKLLADRENAYLSKTLAKINTEVPLGIELEDIACKGMDKAGLYKKFSELELNSLITKYSLTASKSEEKE
jgi:DNA polymerase-1